jgi:hypothetical protein
MVNTLLLANDTAHAARAEGRAALTDAELSTIRPAMPGRSPVAGRRTPTAATRCTRRPAPCCDASSDIGT